MSGGLRQCFSCNGSGGDDTDFTGRCFVCTGHGWADDDFDEDVQSDTDVAPPSETDDSGR